MMRFILPGRRSIWWSCRVTFRCKWRMTGEADQSWHSFCVAGALNLVKLEGDSCCSAHCKWRFTGEADQSWDSFCVAGAVFGEVGVWLFVEGAAFRSILGDSRSTTCFIFAYKMRLQDVTSQVSEAAGARRQFHGRIMLGSWSNRLYFGESNWGISRPNFKLRVSLKGDFTCSADCKWRFICDADQSCDSFCGQAQYLVSLNGDFTCSADCKWRFMCEADHWCDSFCVAGAVCGEVTRWLLLFRAL